MSRSDKATRPYNSVLRLIERKERDVARTLHYIECVELALFRVIGASMAFCDAGIAADLVDEVREDSEDREEKEDGADEGQERGQEENARKLTKAELIEMLCAFSSFRAVPEGWDATLPDPTNAEGRRRLGEHMAKEHRRRFGDGPSEPVAAYFEGTSRAETHEGWRAARSQSRWQDNLLAAEQVVRNSGDLLDMARFAEFSRCLLLNKAVIKCKAPNGPCNAISQIFGKGKKADSAAQAVIEHAVSEACLRAHSGWVSSVRDAVAAKVGKVAKADHPGLHAFLAGKFSDLPRNSLTQKVMGDSGVTTPSAAKIACDVIDSIDYPTVGDVLAASARALGHPDAKTMAEAYGDTGRESSCRILMGKPPEEHVNLPVVAKKLASDAKSHHSKTAVLPHRDAVASLLVSEVTRLMRRRYKGFRSQDELSPNDKKAWIEAWKNFAATVNGKFERNCAFALEKLELQAEIDKNGGDDIVPATAAIKSYMDTLDAELRWVPKPFHVAGLDSHRSHLEAAASSPDVKEEDRHEVAWANFSQEFDPGSREPSRGLVEHLTAHGITEGHAVKACKLLTAQDRLSSRRPHSLSPNLPSCTYGPSNMDGRIVAPGEKFNGEFCGHRPDVWATLKLINEDGTWSEHHVPVSNSRYKAEVHASRFNPDGSPAIEERDYPRDRKHGYKPSGGIGAEAIGRVRSSGRLKASKRYERTVADLRWNVRWDDRTTFTLRKCAPGRFSNPFMVTINHRNPNHKLETEVVVGDTLAGVDLGQHKPAAFVAIRCVAAGQPGFDSRGRKWQVVEATKIDPQISVRGGKVLNQLTNMGIEYGLPGSGYDEVVTGCRAFLESHAHLWTPRERTRTPLEAIDALCAKSPPLYGFHLGYARILRSLMHSAAEMAKRGCDGLSDDERLDRVRQAMRPFRDHIGWWLLQERETPSGRLSPMRLRGLTNRALDASKKVIGLMNSYLSLMGWKKDEEREQGDRELLGATKRLYASLENRRLEVVKVTESNVIRLCRGSGATHLAVENELPKQGSGASRSANSGRQDWRSRELAKRLCGENKDGSAFLAGVRCRKVRSWMTSHMVPFLHTPDSELFSARYKRLRVDDISDKDAESIRSILGAKKGPLHDVYRASMLRFAADHGLDAEEMRRRKDGQYYRDRLPAGSEVFVPRHFGDVFLSPNRVASGETVTVGGRTLWVEDADIVAAANIALSYLDDSKPKKTGKPKKNGRKAS